MLQYFLLTRQFISKMVYNKDFRRNGFNIHLSQGHICVCFKRRKTLFINGLNQHRL